MQSKSTALLFLLMQWRIHIISAATVAAQSESGSGGFEFSTSTSSPVQTYTQVTATYASRPPSTPLSDMATTGSEAAGIQGVRVDLQCTNSGFLVEVISSDSMSKALPKQALLGSKTVPGKVLNNKVVFFARYTDVRIKTEICGHAVELSSTLVLVKDRLNWTYSLSCRLPRQELDSSFGLKVTEHLIDSVPGQLSKVEMFKDETFTFPIDVLPSGGQTVYIRVKSTTQLPDDVILVVHSCAATNPGGNIVSLTMNSCPIGKEVSVVATQNHATYLAYTPSGNRFLPDLVACSSRLCLATDFSPECSQACGDRSLYGDQIGPTLPPD